MMWPSFILIFYLSLLKVGKLYTPQDSQTLEINNIHNYYLKYQKLPLAPENILLMYGAIP